MRQTIKIKLDATQATAAVEDLTEKIKLLRAEVEALTERMAGGLTFDEYYNRARAGALILEPPMRGAPWYTSLRESMDLAKVGDNG